MSEYRTFYRRHLPHWQPKAATLFVTFRLAGSLPREVIEALIAVREREKEALAGIAEEGARGKQMYDDERRAFGRWDAALDASKTGPHWLRQLKIANILVEALHYRHERVYELVAFCIMPNHVHVVFTPLKQERGSFHPLERIMQSLKRHTARQANIVLGRKDPFWQAESYDHFVRDEGELNRIIQYVIYNPVKAGLIADWKDWPWTHISADFDPV